MDNTNAEIGIVDMTNLQRAVALLEAPSLDAQDHERTRLADRSRARKTSTIRSRQHPACDEARVGESSRYCLFDVFQA